MESDILNDICDGRKLYDWVVWGMYIERRFAALLAGFWLVWPFSCMQIVFQCGNVPLEARSNVFDETGDYSSLKCLETRYSDLKLLHVLAPSMHVCTLPHITTM